jgi:hypothetical protein
MICKDVYWLLASSSDAACLKIVDGLDEFSAFGPHYSRRTPGSKTFTGIGQEIVLISRDKTAVWAVDHQRTPSRRGSGGSRGRTGTTDPKPVYVWRNMLFRNLGNVLSSDLIKHAVWITYQSWINKYGTLPNARLRTEIDPKRVRSTNPGYCYKKAGFFNARRVRGKIYLDAPCWDRVVQGQCSCCLGSNWSPAETQLVIGTEKSTIRPENLQLILPKVEQKRGAGLG